MKEISIKRMIFIQKLPSSPKFDLPDELVCNWLGDFRADYEIFTDVILIRDLMNHWTEGCLIQFLKQKSRQKIGERNITKSDQKARCGYRPPAPEAVMLACNTMDKAVRSCIQIHPSRYTWDLIKVWRSGSMASHGNDCSLKLPNNISFHLCQPLPYGRESCFVKDCQRTWFVGIFPSNGQVEIADFLHVVVHVTGEFGQGADTACSGSVIEKTE